jgi:hypothetical protein
MIVRLDTWSLSVEEADDLRRLSVACEGIPAKADAVLRRAGLGVIDQNGDALLNVAALRDLASSASTRSDWDDGWVAMISYASGKGWISADGRDVRAHVEPST